MAITTRPRVARIAGTALVPGVSHNGRLYSRDLIKRAAARLAEQIGTRGAAPVSMLTHHEAEDDSTRIVGKLTRAYVDPSGALRYEADIADTPNGRTLASLARHGYVNGVSIRGRWVGQPRTETHAGQRVETADDLEVYGLDWTKTPGVEGARVERVVMEAAARRGELVERCDAATVTETTAAGAGTAAGLVAQAVTEIARDEPDKLARVPDWALGLSLAERAFAHHGGHRSPDRGWLTETAPAAGRPAAGDRALHEMTAGQFRDAWRARLAEHVASLEWPG